MMIRRAVANTIVTMVMLVGGMAPSNPLQARERAPDTWTAMNVPVTTHDGDRVRFYDDLVKGRVVLINFIFTTCTNECPRTTGNLLKVQDLLGDRLGRDVHMISVTVDPATDTPRVLKKFVVTYGAKRGWSFVTGRQKDLDLIRRRLGVLDGSVDRSQHTGVLVYGNDATGQWAATPAMSRPDAIVRSVMRLANRPLWN